MPDHFDLQESHRRNSDWAPMAKALKLTTLREDGKPHRSAGGFVVELEGKLFLYTCWHVVTGLNFLDLKVKDPPQPRKLKITSKQLDVTDGVVVSGGINHFTIELYADESPVWEQDYGNTKPHPDLNSIGVEVPMSLDVVRIQIPQGCVPQAYVCKERDIANYLVGGSAWSAVLIVGYPYGFSALGEANLEPVKLHRYVSVMCATTAHDSLLDGTGLPCMSGCPIFDSQFRLVGIYRGSIYTDSETRKIDGKRNDQYSAMGPMTQAVFLKDGLSTRC